MTDQRATTVSVVIPAFNAELFIGRAIKSALDQTWPPLEVIVADDASSDGTREAVEALVATDARVRLVKLPTNGGPSAARNAGFNAARGEWIAVLDADDAYRPSRLEMLVELGRAYEADIVADNIGLYDVQARETVASGVSSLHEIRIVNRYDYVSRCRGNREDVDWGLLHPMFRRQFLKSHALSYPENLRHGEDFAFMFSALLEGAKFVFTPEMGYVYTQRWGSYSNTPSGMSRTRIDYKTIVGHTLSLMEDPRLRSDHTMLSLLRQRYYALRAVDVQYRMPTYLKERDLPNIAKLLTYDLGAWLILMKAIRGKASSLIGLQ